eukprot:3778542-Pyramimonas_sp.AAC.1
MADDCLDHWSTIWALHGCQQLQRPDDWQQWDKLPPITGDQARRVIRKFKRHTARGQINMQPRSLDV